MTPVCPASSRRLPACGCSQLQLTLVDCPGHASLIRTIIGGAQIIDLMMLVIDITKGVGTGLANPPQTHTTHTQHTHTTTTTTTITDAYVLL